MTDTLKNPGVVSSAYCEEPEDCEGQLDAVWFEAVDGDGGEGEPSPTEEPVHYVDFHMHHIYRIAYELDLNRNAVLQATVQILLEQNAVAAWDIMCKAIDLTGKYRYWSSDTRLLIWSRDLAPECPCEGPCPGLKHSNTVYT